MIHSLSGILLEFEEDYAVVDVNGMRFQVEIPGSTAGAMPQAGSAVELLTILSFNANDGCFSLFGFATRMERDCFEVLTSLSGIGPRKALVILSQIEIGAFARAITSNDIKYVSGIKGVGKKTAERLIVELREKMIPFVAEAPAVASTAAAGRENISDAIKALMALGVRAATAEKAVHSAVEVCGEEAPTEELVREGLKHR